MNSNAKRIICTILICLSVVTIWGFSLRNGAQSHGQSGDIVVFCDKVCKKLNINISSKWYKIYAPFVQDPSNITKEEAIRKTAHFTEYFILGFFCALMACFNRRSKFAYLFLIMGVAVSYIDERVIQLHIVSGRTSSLKDVLLDCIGFYLCFSLIALISIPFKRRKNYVRE